jgi:hypothetical protein
MGGCLVAEEFAPLQAIQTLGARREKTARTGIVTRRNRFRLKGAL